MDDLHIYLKSSFHCICNREAKINFLNSMKSIVHQKNLMHLRCTCWQNNFYQFKIEINILRVLISTKKVICVLRSFIWFLHIFKTWSVNWEKMHEMKYFEIIFQQIQYSRAFSAIRKTSPKCLMLFRQFPRIVSLT